SRRAARSHCPSTGTKWNREPPTRRPPPTAPHRPPPAPPPLLRAYPDRHTRPPRRRSPSARAESSARQRSLPQRASQFSVGGLLMDHAAPHPRKVLVTMSPKRNRAPAPKPTPDPPHSPHPP